MEPPVVKRHTKTTGNTWRGNTAAKVSMELGRCTLSLIKTFSRLSWLLCFFDCSSLTKLSSPEDTNRTLPPRSGMSSSSMGQRGRSWSNLSLSHAPSMSSVMEEPRRSTSTTSKSTASLFFPSKNQLLPTLLWVYTIGKDQLLSLFFLFSTDVSDMHKHDPLADATYIRANFTYIPRTPKELQIKTGDVFHIHDEVLHIQT